MRLVRRWRYHECHHHFLRDSATCDFGAITRHLQTAHRSQHRFGRPSRRLQGTSMSSQRWLSKYDMETLQFLCVYFIAHLRTVAAGILLAMLVQGI